MPPWIYNEMAYDESANFVYFSIYNLLFEANEPIGIKFIMPENRLNYQV